MTHCEKTENRIFTNYQWQKPRRYVIIIAGQNKIAIKKPLISWFTAARRVN